MRKLYSRLITDAIEACLAQTDGVLPADVLEHLLATSRAELEPYYEANFRKGLLSDIRQELKNLTLNDGVATGEPTQWPLPGFKAPTTLPILQANGDFRYMLFVKLTGKDFLQAIATRKDGIAHDRKRLQDLEDKWAVLRPYLLRDESMTVEDAVQLLAGGAHQREGA